VTEPQEATLDELLDTKIVCSPKRPPIVPKTIGQRAYIQAIQTHDMVFGVGPAGTGKTYLAMATAVAALKKRAGHAHHSHPPRGRSGRSASVFCPAI